MRSEAREQTGETLLDHVRAFVVELHDRFRPGCREAVEQAVAAAGASFRRTQRGTDVVFVRGDLA